MEVAHSYLIVDLANHHADAADAVAALLPLEHIREARPKAVSLRISMRHSRHRKR
jgi:hypothetical protein